MLEALALLRRNVSVLRLLGASLAAFGIIPSARNLSAASEGDVRLAAVFLMLQAKQVRTGLILMAAGSLMEWSATFMSALPLFAD